MSDVLARVDALKLEIDKAETIQESERGAAIAKGLAETIGRDKSLLREANELNALWVRALRKTGEFLLAQPRKNPGQNFHSSTGAMAPVDETFTEFYLSEGLTEDGVKVRQKLAKLGADEFEARIRTALNLNTDETLSLRKILNRTAQLNILMSESEEWYTPPEYVASARTVMGSIDIDPATNPTAQKVINAAVHYTKTMNGLNHQWNGNLWLNPPWGKACADFVARAVLEYEAGNVTQAVLLVNSNSNDTEWFQPLWDHVLCFTRGRINFISPDGEATGSTHGSCFAYLGSNTEKFKNEFKRYGPIVTRIA